MGGIDEQMGGEVEEKRVDGNRWLEARWMFTRTPFLPIFTFKIWLQSIAGLFPLWESWNGSDMRRYAGKPVTLIRNSRLAGENRVTPREKERSKPGQ